MAITKDEVVEYLKGITLLEASELVKELEEVLAFRLRPLLHR